MKKHWTEKIEELTKETWSLGTERDELKVHIRELEAELEARKKAWEGLVEWVNTTWVQEGALGFKGALADKLTALEATLPKGGV